MRPFFESKTWVILLALIAFGGLVLLASSLDEMNFPPIFSAGTTRSGSPFDFSSLEGGMEGLGKYLLPSLLVIAYLLSLGKPRQQNGNDSLLAALIRALGFILFIVLVFGQMAKRNNLISEEMMGEGGVPLQTAPELPDIQPFSAPDVSIGSTFGVVGLLLLVFGAAAVFFINRAFDRLPKPASEMKELAAIARTALGQLDAKPSKNIIIKSYLDMNAAVGEKRGLIREEAMTPAEFAVRLDSLGLPLDAVHGLTEVFERVRYGGQDVGAEETEEAKRCLTSILKACETKK